MRAQKFKMTVNAVGLRTDGDDQVNVSLEGENDMYFSWCCARVDAPQAGDVVEITVEET